MFILVISMFTCLIFNILTYDIGLICKQFWYTDVNDLDLIDQTSINETKCNCTNKIDWNNQIGSLCTHVYWLGESRFATQYQIISSINFWIHAIIFRTLPCILMLVLSCLLINIMHKANIKKKALIQQGKKTEYEKASEFNRTTTMLLIIVILFFIMEFPHGIHFFLLNFKNKIIINFNNRYFIFNLWFFTGFFL